jgi:hypothetical protein
MGIEHYLVCNQCKEYIDCHKNYKFKYMIEQDRPPFDFNDEVDFASYWSNRAVWFLWNHRGHEGIEIHLDCNDECYDLRPYLKEIYPHDEEMKLRKKNET